MAMKLDTPVAKQLIAIQEKLCQDVDSFVAGEPVAYTYNPLDYAKASSEMYLKEFGAILTPRVLLLGMNPGPWGMAQSGIPFGDTDVVRDWMQIEATIGKPPHEHPKRPVDGLDCSRNEVSGSRLWGWAKDRFGTARNFFEYYFVWNYCPLSFMLESGANFTPNKLPKEKREVLFRCCDEALRSLVETLKFTHLIGVGAFAEKRLLANFKEEKHKGTIIIGRILHPSPASPLANKGWASAAENDLMSLGALKEVSK